MNRDHLTVLGNAELARDLLVGPPDRVIQQLSGRLLAGAGEVVEKACQLDAPVHRVLYDLSPHPALANQQTFVDEFLYRTPRRRPRQRQSLRQSQLILKAVTGREFAITYRRLYRLGKLIVEGNRA